MNARDLTDGGNYQICVSTELGQERSQPDGCLPTALLLRELAADTRERNEGGKRADQRIYVRFRTDIKYMRREVPSIVLEIAFESHPARDAARDNAGAPTSQTCRPEW
jgi:hypothetical protein